MKPAVDRAARIPAGLPIHHLLVALFFFAISLFWIRPLPSNFARLLPGTNDLWLQIWNQWWIKTAIFELGRNPMQCDFMFWPVGVNLYYHALSPLNSFVAAALSFVLGQVAAFNTIFHATFWISGYGAWLSARRLGCRTAPALAAGYIYAFSPYHFLHQRQLEHMSVEWIPFIFYFLISAIETGRSWRAVVAGFFFAVNYYTNVYYGLFAGVMAILIFFYDINGARADSIRRWLAFTATAVLMIAPYLWNMVSLSGAPGRFKVPLFVNVYQSLDLLALVTPGTGNTLLRDWFPTMNLYETFTGWEPIGFLGFTVIALACYGALRGLGRRRVFLLGLAAVFVTLSLGPVLHVAGIVRLPNGDPVILPQAILQTLPVISAARVPARYLAVAMLPIAILAGMGLDRVGAEWSGRRSAAIVGLLAALIVVEYWHEPIETSEVGTTPAFCERIAADPGDVAVLDLPMRIAADSAEWWRSTDPDTRGWYQTLHGKRTLLGPASHTALTRENFLFFLQSPLLGPLVSEDTSGLLAREEARAEMKMLKISYVVLHRYLYDRMPVSELERDRKIVEDQWGFTRIHEDNDVVLFAANSD